MTSRAGALELKSLVGIGLVTLVLRVTVALSTPELELDAYGHFKLAQAWLKDPTNLRVHWVWLPGWHVLLAGALRLGLGHTGVRVVNSVIQTLGPWLLYRVVSDSGAERAESDRALARSAALFYTVAPLPNVMGASAQAETFFSLLLLGTSWALIRQRGSLAGGFLALASLLRYEAWGVVALLGVKASMRPRSRRSALLAFAVAAGFIAAWLGLRRLSGLPWFSFASATRAFVDRYHASVERSASMNALTLISLPLVALGPAVLLAFLGLGALRKRAAEVPLGLSSFLVVSALGGGLLALPRYFTALTPFACIAIASGTARWCTRSGAPKESRAVWAVTASLVFLTLAHFVFALYRVRAP